MRSYFILGIYSLLVAAFFNWDASIFLVITAMIVELIILSLGMFLLRKTLIRKKNDVTPMGFLFAVAFMLAICLPIGYNLGLYYNEFPNDPSLMWWEKVFTYKWSLLVIAISFAVGYLTDLKQITHENRGERLTTELFRLSIQIFFISWAGMLCILFGTSMMTVESETLSKWIPIALMIVLRMGIEIWYMDQKKNENFA